MATFKNKKLGGQVYDLSHLEPLLFTLGVDGLDLRIRTTFSCHTFTETFDPRAHTPAEWYHHRGERRAFSVNRHQLSLALPELIRTQNSHSVYHTRKGTFFILKGLTAAPGGAPYAVFFAAERSKQDDADVYLRVQSAYEKPNMVTTASPVAFTNLMRAVANGHPVQLGPRRQIKRR